MPAGWDRRYIAGLMRFRDDDGLPAWIEHFAAATAGAARLAARYLDEVAGLDREWRDALEASSSPPRRDATAWAIIGELPASI